MACDLMAKPHKSARTKKLYNILIIECNLNLRPTLALRGRQTPDRLLDIVDIPTCSPDEMQSLQLQHCHGLFCWTGSSRGWTASG